MKMNEDQKKLNGYVIGFLLSLFLSVLAYVVVRVHISFQPRLTPNIALVSVIFSLAFIQLAIQLYYFLHLGGKSGERWKQIAFFLALGFIFIVVVGSIWIMNHLNYNMSPEQINQYLIDQSG